ncbi:hypothetical protein DCC84_32585 [Pseudomonas sp. SXM-1]|nr:hypothetical protein DCC84_32585 [Pseudomonas sp. SXM-1]
MARELAPAGSRSGPEVHAILKIEPSDCFGAAAQPSGSKLPRHTLRAGCVGKYVSTHLVRIHAGLDQRIQGAVDHRR